MAIIATTERRNCLLLRIFFFIPTMGTSVSLPLQKGGNLNAEQLNYPVLDQYIAGSVPTPSSANVLRSVQNVQSCFSLLNNDSIPSAHIRGSMYNVPARSDQLYYSMGWECSSADGVAFVDGGMNFSASDQSLQVPQTGYYFISSQVYFQVDKAVAQNRAVYHQILVNPNCNSNSRNRVYSQSYASPADGSVELPTVTTHSSLVMKLCTGGKIKVVVPKPPPSSQEGAPCCPYSLATATFFDAYLIQN